MAVSPENVATTAMLALSIGSVAYTVSSSKISAPLRVAVAKRAIERKSKGWRWLADLLACPYCVSHWLAFAAVLVYRPWLVGAEFSEAVAPGWFGRVFDFFVTSMALVTLAMVPVWLIKRALAGTGAAPGPGASAPPGPSGNSARANASAPERVARAESRGTPEQPARPPDATLLDEPMQPPPGPPGGGGGTRPTDRTQIL